MDQRLSRLKLVTSACESDPVSKFPAFKIAPWHDWFQLLKFLHASCVDCGMHNLPHFEDQSSLSLITEFVLVDCCYNKPSWTCSIAAYYLPP